MLVYEADFVYIYSKNTSMHINYQPVKVIWVFDKDTPGGLKRYFSMSNREETPVEDLGHIPNFQNRFSLPQLHNKDLLNLHSRGKKKDKKQNKTYFGHKSVLIKVPHFIGRQILHEF